MRPLPDDPNEDNFNTFEDVFFPWVSFHITRGGTTEQPPNALCCMIYDLRHVLGNLTKQSYESLFEGVSIDISLYSRFTNWKTFTLKGKLRGSKPISEAYLSPAQWKHVKDEWDYNEAIGWRWSTEVQVFGKPLDHSRHPNAEQTRKMDEYWSKVPKLALDFRRFNPGVP